MVENENSDSAKDNSNKNFETMAIMVGEPAREYIARVKGLTNAVKYHRVELANIKVCRRMLNGLPSALNFVREGFALKAGYSLIELERALINAG